MRRRHSWIALAGNLAVFLLLETAAFHLVRNSGSLQRVWMARKVHAVTGGLWNSSQSIREYFSLRKANQALALENLRLEEELLQAREQLREKRIGPRNNPVAPGFSTLEAEVVRLSRGSQHNYLILNRGYEDGVREKSGVITRCGVVGIVDAVSAHYAFASSFQNNDISISARLGREGSSGLLVWKGRGNRGLLKELPLQYKYEPGDTVYTSGHSLLFPPDIPLGIAGKARVVNGSTHELEVSLFQDFSAVRYVTVVHNNSFDEIQQFTP